MEQPARFDVAGVRHYYDTRTPAFVALGQGRELGAIHRAVWGPGVTDERAAFTFIEEQIATLIRGLTVASGTPHVVDLGCGVGASLQHLATRLPIRGTGITVSPVQARLGTERLAAAGLADRVVCIEGDYGHLPADLEPADVAFAIESFVHAPDPVRFFEECARVIRPGGLFAVCDDFRRPTGGPAADRAIEQFCRGWRVNTLILPDQLRALAAAAGFEHQSTVDLTPYLEIYRLRDRVISALLSLAGALVGRTRLDHFAGGRAIQLCLDRGWVGYDLAVFRRV